MSNNNTEIRINITPTTKVIKRTLDIIVSVVCMVVFSPLYLYCYIIVKKEHNGSVIYSQERIGKGGKPFKIYKLRTMKEDAEESGPALFDSDNDPRLTEAGLFLRSHHLDELPQLWNVFIGDMSFVGPRPERRYFIEKIMERDSRYPLLYNVRPGVTSYATLYNGYTDTMEKMLRRLELDLYYLEHQSIAFDIKILWNTFTNIAFGKRF